MEQRDQKLMICNNMHWPAICEVLEMGNSKPKSSHSIFELFDSVVERILLAHKIGLKFVGILSSDFDVFLIILSCSITAPVPFLEVSTSMYKGILES